MSTEHLQAERMYTHLTSRRRVAAGEAMLMATACEGGVVRVHDVQSGASLYDLTDEARGDNQWGASSRSSPTFIISKFSKNAVHLAVAFGGSSVQLLDGETGEHVLTLRTDHNAHVSAIVWSDDGLLLGVAHTDGMCRLWDVSAAITDC